LGEERAELELAKFARRFEAVSGHALDDLASRFRSADQVRGRIELSTLAVCRYGLRVRDIAALTNKHRNSVTKWLNKGLRRERVDPEFFSADKSTSVYVAPMPTSADKSTSVYVAPLPPAWHPCLLGTLASCNRAGSRLAPLPPAPTSIAPDLALSSIGWTRRGHLVLLEQRLEARVVP